MLSRAPVVAPRPATGTQGATTSSPASSVGVDTKMARRSVEPRGLHDNPSAENYAVGDSSLRIIHLSTGRFQVRTAVNGSYASRECSLYPPVHRACKRSAQPAVFSPKRGGPAWNRTRDLSLIRTAL